MTFDHELILISIAYTENDMGDPVEIKEETRVLCDVQSVGRNEHYSAMAYGLKPEIVFIVNKYDYDGQKVVKFEGEEYNVTRTYQPKKSKDIGDFETVELICSGVVNDGTT